MTTTRFNNRTATSPATTLQLQTKNQWRVVVDAKRSADITHQNQNHTMKKTVIFIFAACTLFFSGCCTTPHVAKWEYKVVTAPELTGTMGQPNREVAQRRRANEQEYLNELGKDGWMIVSEDSGTFYLRRPLK